MLTENRNDFAAHSMFAYLPLALVLSATRSFRFHFFLFSPRFAFLSIIYIRHTMRAQTIVHRIPSRHFVALT